MSKLFTNSYMRPVYYERGENAGQKVFKRAPFDVLVIDGTPHVQPRTIGGTDKAFTMLGVDNVIDQDKWRDHDIGGYETLQPIVVGEHQMGDGTDNWIGMVAFGNI